MVNVKDTVCETRDSAMVAERDGSVTLPADSRSGRSEMVVVIGGVALASMVFGFVLGLLF